MASSDEGSSSEDDFRGKHECTDVLCTLLFLVATVVFAGVMCWSLVSGDTRRLSRGLDGHGQLCGLEGNVSDKPFLYFCPKEMAYRLRILHIDPRNPVCVSSCPTGTYNNFTNETHVTPPTIPDCPAAVTEAYLSEDIAGLYCLPSKYYSSAALQEVDEATSNLADSMEASLGVAMRSWPVLLLVVLAATLLGYIYLWLLRVTAKCLIWICVVVAMAALIILGVYFWTNEDLIPEVTEGVADQDEAGWREAARQGLKLLAIVLWVLAFLVLCLACCCGHSVELSTSCVQTATVVIWRMPAMLLAPFVKAIVKTFFTLLFIYGFMHLWVMGEVRGVGLHKKFHQTPQQWAVILFYGYVAFWVLAFITALYQFSIAYAVAKYYESPEDEEGDKEVDSCGVVEGTLVGLMKHTGSLAYGAAVIAALELIQKILEYVERKNEELGEGGNKCVKCILRSCLCCCRCFEGIIQFINKNAYIDIAVTGDTNFCRAVRNVMKVVIDFGAAMAILNGATYIFQIVGMASITALCGLLAGTLLTTEAFADPSSEWFIGNPTLPIVVSCVIAFTVAWAFMSIFDVTTDTLLYCYAEDKDKHMGAAVHVPSDMRSLYEEAEEQAKEVRSKQTEEERSVQARGYGRVRRAG